MKSDSIIMGENGSVLVYVLLMGLLMSILMAGILVMIDAPYQYFQNDFDQVQSYYNAKMGIVVAEAALGQYVQDSSSLTSIEKDYTSLDANTSSWSVLFNPPQVTGTTSTITTLTFTITSTGRYKSYATKLSATSTVDVKT